VTEYNSAFFDEQQERSAQSAREIVPTVMRLIRPKSVVDVGCGVGAWLKVFKELGVKDVVGLDGNWALRYWQLESHEFIDQDVAASISLSRRFDLVVCLEVGEHVPADSAPILVESLCKLGPVVLFSAAVPLQGGVHHVNEQWPDYWAALFEARGYTTVDGIRATFWNNPKIDWWYVQNSLLFVDSSRLKEYPELASQPSIAELCVVHPRHYLEKARRANIGLAEVLKMFAPLARDAFARRARAFSAAIGNAFVKRTPETTSASSAKHE
jgi:SAM-dependent methyltransferase